MKTEKFTTVEEIFAELKNNHNLESYDLNAQQINQLQGQVEEGLGLIADVVEELRPISSETVDLIKSLTLKIFDADG